MLYILAWPPVLCQRENCVNSGNCQAVKVGWSSVIDKGSKTVSSLTIILYIPEVFMQMIQGSFVRCAEF